MQQLSPKSHEFDTEQDETNINQSKTFNEDFGGYDTPSILSSKIVDHAFDSLTVSNCRVGLSSASRSWALGR